MSEIPTALKALSPEKAPAAMFVTLDGIVMLTMFVQFAKLVPSISVVPSENARFVTGMPL